MCRGGKEMGRTVTFLMGWNIRHIKGKTTCKISRHPFSSSYTKGMSRGNRLNKSQNLVENHGGKWSLFCQMTLHPTILNFLEMYITFIVNWLVLFMTSWVILTGQRILQAVSKNV